MFFELVGTLLAGLAAALLVFAVRRSFAVAARAGMIALPFVQLVVDGPYRTAATGALMTFIGMRFVVAALAERRTSQAPSTGAAADDS